MENKTIKKLALITSLIIIILINSIAFAAFADFDDETADKETEQLIENQQKTENENKGKSTNNYLNLLTVKGYEIEPKFDKQTQEYKITEEVDTDEIILEAKADNDKSTVSGNGKVKLQSGENNIRIDVQSESGSVRTYFLKVMKKVKKEDLKLISLNLNEVDNNLNTRKIELDPQFSKDIFTYKAKIYNDTIKINVDAKCNREGAKITVEGNENIKEGKNEILVTISDNEENNKTVYKIVIEKKESIQANANITNETEENNKIIIVSIIILASILIIVFFIIKHKKYSKH